jgi:hypothetical protein
MSDNPRNPGRHGREDVNKKTSTTRTAPRAETWPNPAADVPARTSGQRSATTSAVTDRTPEEAELLAGEQTPATSERVMGLPDSPSAAETGTGR